LQLNYYNACGILRALRRGTPGMTRVLGGSRGRNTAERIQFFVKGPSPLYMVKEIAPKFTFFLFEMDVKERMTRGGVKSKRHFKKKRVSLVRKLKICTVDFLNLKFATYC
jgi:hypothetical protein